MLKRFLFAWTPYILIGNFLLPHAPIKAIELSTTPVQLNAVKSEIEPFNARSIEAKQIVELPVESTPEAYSGACGDNADANFIYMKESGCRTDAINPSSGACSLGQALPCSKLSNVCPNWQTDFDCDNRFFTSYAVERYGSWEAAHSFWISHNWW